MRDASREVNRYTLERAEAVLAANSDLSLIEKIKFAACAVAEVIYQYGNQIMGRRDIASESVGDHSVSYLSADQLRANEVHAITETINGYLGLTGLMFWGEQMITPHNMTWYEGNNVNNVMVYTRHEVPEVMWQASKAANVIKSGLQEADRTNIWVPYKLHDGTDRSDTFELQSG